jgi:hypothetical protein
MNAEILTERAAIEAVPVANLIIRGKIYSDHLIEVGGRGGDITFLTPDVRHYIDQLPLGNPVKLADLYTLKFQDILDYLEEVGRKLDIRTNPHLQQARNLSYFTAPTTKPIVDMFYETLHQYFNPGMLREVVEKQVGIDYLEGWVETKLGDGRTIGIRCFGSRCLHIVAGNAPAISAQTIIRNALMRCDAIIKAPSNDPFTALAIVQTMCEMAPDHPITKHISVGYWKGGDKAVEEKLYQPHNIEKITAWGGYASVKHVSQYIQPGIELISLDPKRSASIVGQEAFESEDMMRTAAQRIASDVGTLNQAACVNARVIYVQSGTDEAGLENLKKLGRYTYEAMMGLPERVSTKPKRYDRDLKAHLDTVRLDDDWFHVVGGEEGEGAIIVSLLPEPVDFETKLNDRTANLVPVDKIEDILKGINSYTQTVGIFPESLKQKFLDILPLYGAQRFVSLGYATSYTLALPQDGIEPMRRLGKWITNEICSPETVAPPWK